MRYTCPICQDSIKDELAAYIQHTEGHIVEVIKAKHPDWIEGDGLCQKCLDYYRRELKGD